MTRSSFDGSEAFGLSEDVNSGGVLRLTEPRSNRGGAAAPPYQPQRAKMKTTLKEL